MITRVSLTLGGVAGQREARIQRQILSWICSVAADPKTACKRFRSSRQTP
jgi:hypothetical protein